MIRAMALLTVFLPVLLPCFSRLHAQPSPTVRLAAEWEPSYGTLIRWPLGIPSSLAVELALHDSLYVLVANWAQEAEAIGAFSSWGVNLNHCRFLHIPTNSHWTRDWGPHWAFDGNGQCGIIDPIFEGYPWGPGGPYAAYNRELAYELDNLVNSALAQELGCPIWEFPAYLTGGNFMTDGHGTGFSVLSMLTENEQLWTHEEFLALSESWLGLSTYHILINPEEYGLQHIDCAAKLLNEETILLKDVPEWHPDHPRLAAINDMLTTAVSCYGRPYNVVRIFCDSYSGNAVAAYTNSYILNRRVFVPLFGIPSDGPALETYQNAMPGYEIIGIPFGAWYYYDALHCRTREMTDREMLLIQHRPLDQQVPWEQWITVDCMIRPYSGAALIPEETLVHHREQGSGEWQTTPLNPSGTDSLEALIPGYPVDAVVEYFIAAADLSGRAESHPRTAPAGFHSFTVTQGTGMESAHTRPAVIVSAGPNPFTESIGVTFSTDSHRYIELAVYDLAGRPVTVAHRGEAQPGVHTVGWDGRDSRGGRAPAGTYLLRLRWEGGGETFRALYLP